ncbi:MAG TPA: hypothetical protein VIB82_08430, partial [Caulobacteraceae bacterium]
TVTNGSAADTKASLQGVFGVLGQVAAVTVGNFGSIQGSLVGVYSTMGGKVTNGSTSDTAATISGSLVGVDILGAPGTVINFGTIRGGAFTAAGVGLTGGGTITNGSATDHAALIQGFFGVQGPSNVKVSNFGTIKGNSASTSIGVYLGTGGALTNYAGAYIDGYTGVTVGATSTVNNFGTIHSLSGNGVVLVTATSRLNAEAGSVIEGALVAGSGLVDVVSGVASVFAIDTGGKVEGAGTLLLSGGESFLDSGASLLVSKIELAGAATAVEIEGKLVDSRIWDQTAGTLFVDSAEQITFTGKSNSFTGTVTGTGAVVFNGGADAFTDLTMSAGKLAVSKAAVTLSGTIGLTKTLTATTPNLIVADAGATLTGGGTILLTNAATNSIHGASAAATLTNGDIIKGAGKLGGGVMTLINTAAGTIENAGSVALTVDTGAATIANAGLIEAFAGGGLAIAGAVNNTGTLATANGTLTVNGAVSGAGIVKVTGGVADFTGAFSENVTFGTTGRLVLAHGQAYGGTISGFSHTGASSLDLSDITFSGATKATYSGTAAAGILTVTDGTHTANIHLTGNYLSAIWTLSAASGGGTHVVDPTAPKPAATPLVAAMAGFGASNAGSAASQPASGSPVLVSLAHAA